MKTEDTTFEGGPMDGRVLPVLLGITGHPPKTYRIPVPAPDGGPPTVLVYRRVPSGPGTRPGLSRRWKYAYDPDPDAARAAARKWPWSKPAAGPHATPSGKPPDPDE